MTRVAVHAPLDLRGRQRVDLVRVEVADHVRKMAPDGADPRLLRRRIARQTAHQRERIGHSLAQRSECVVAHPASVALALAPEVLNGGKLGMKPDAEQTSDARLGAHLVQPRAPDLRRKVGLTFQHFEFGLTSGVISRPRPVSIITEEGRQPFSFVTGWFLGALSHIPWSVAAHEQQSTE